MVDYLGKVVPIFHCTLTSKNKKLYEAVFQYIKDTYPDFRPTTVMLDFEASLTIALRKVYPDVRIVGCRFHYGQVLIFKKSFVHTNTYVISCFLYNQNHSPHEFSLGRFSTVLYMPQFY